jgi:hypothetical protein
MGHVNDMNEPMGIVEETLGSSMKRRDFLTKAAAAGAIAWSAPIILSRTAYAAENGGGTPKCRPTITPSCNLLSCDQGQKNFPGLTLNISACPCSSTVPKQQPATCIKIIPIPPATQIMCGSKQLLAYGNMTQCGPNPSTPDHILSSANGNWVCFDPTTPIFFGPPRNGNGAIDDISTCSFSFRMAVWAGNCQEGQDNSAYNCQTFDVTISYTSGSNATATCNFQPAAVSLCTTGSTQPCTCP